MKGVVVLFWMATMTWLMVDKVLPPLERGDPPTFRSACGILDPKAPPIGWTVEWNDRPIGWAASRVVKPSSGLLQICSRVHFDRWPLEEMLPVWLRSVLQDAVKTFDSLAMDAYNELDVDPLNRLVGFCSTIQIKRNPQAIVVQGTIEGNRLKLEIDAGGLKYTPADHIIPADTLLGNELAPQTTFAGLRIGQTWTVPVYNPLEPDNLMDVLEATVRSSETMKWNGATVDVLVVVYRSDPGGALAPSRTPRETLWVRPDGTVLRQETWLFNSQLTFVRMSPEESARRTADLDETLRSLPAGHSVR